MMDKFIVDALAKRVASNQMTLDQVPEFYKASVQNIVNGGNK